MNEEKQERAVWLTNRQKKRLSHRYQGWCGGCDRNIVPNLKRCEVCRYVNPGVRRNRHDTRV